MIDNLIKYDTPEGTTLELTPAGFVPRLGAWLVDFSIRVGIMLILSFALQFFMEAGVGILLVCYFVIDWFYMVLFEVYREGQTIGKKRYGIKVCTDDGMAVGWRVSMTRNILRVADFLPFLFVGALLSMLFNKQSKRLGDIVAGTLVVYKIEDKLNFDIPAHTPIMPSMPLTFEEQQAILAFAERSDALSPERWAELAQILTPLAHQSNPSAQNNPQQVGQSIVGFANAIIGRGFNNQVNTKNRDIIKENHE